MLKAGLLSRSKPILFKRAYKFYQAKDIAYAVSFIESNKTEKLMFSSSGALINRITDLVVDNTVVRKVINKLIYLEGDKIMYRNENIKLKPVISKFTHKSTISNPNIGSLDLETFIDNDNSVKVYAAVFFD